MLLLHPLPLMMCTWAVSVVRGTNLDKKDLFYSLLYVMMSFSSIFYFSSDWRYLMHVLVWYCWMAEAMTLRS